MKHIDLFNTRTAFIVLLMGTPAFSFDALPPVTVGESNKYTAEEGSVESIADFLEAQGLEKPVALEKAKRLFSSQDQHIDVKLHHLQMHPDLLLDTEKMVKVLARRALFEKPLDLDSYASLVGFIQEVQGTLLKEQTLTAIRQITALNGTLS